MQYNIQYSTVQHYQIHIFTICYTFTQLLYYGITRCFMNDFCLGIAWFWFVEVKKFKNQFVFSCSFFNFSSAAEHVQNLFFFWEILCFCFHFGESRLTSEMSGMTLKDVMTSIPNSRNPGLL